MMLGKRKAHTLLGKRKAEDTAEDTLVDVSPSNPKKIRASSAEASVQSGTSSLPPRTPHTSAASTRASFQKQEPQPGTFPPGFKFHAQIAEITCPHIYVGSIVPDMPPVSTLPKDYKQLLYSFPEFSEALRFCEKYKNNFPPFQQDPRITLVYEKAGQRDMSVAEYEALILSPRARASTLSSPKSVKKVPSFASPPKQESRAATEVKKEAQTAGLDSPKVKRSSALAALFSPSKATPLRRATPLFDALASGMGAIASRTRRKSTGSPGPTSSSGQGLNFSKI